MILFFIFLWSALSEHWIVSSLLMLNWLLELDDKRK